MTANDLNALHVPWLSVHPVLIAPDLQALTGFGAGEAAVISLARLCNARLLLLDDKRARHVACEHGFVLSGTLGVLVRAHQQGYLKAVRPVLDLMIAQGRYISPTLRTQILTVVGEPKKSNRLEGTAVDDTLLTTTGF